MTGVLEGRIEEAEVRGACGPVQAWWRGAVTLHGAFRAFAGTLEFAPNDRGCLAHGRVLSR